MSGGGLSESVEIFFGVCGCAFLGQEAQSRRGRDVIDPRIEHGQAYHYISNLDDIQLQDDEPLWLFLED